ncbi:PFL-like glycyl radical enzyme [Gymnopus androsaceus JB14]|uniref:Ribonucleoside-diphosphate reductase n=1 Tax=Gymnopus androsaceus JB14 TaxID=1447944 RepID=A0A6A4I4R0_9AGAR|nr:PFL-like glycyl radical enzyme [Gymnopus androsaceus JB14]
MDCVSERDSLVISWLNFALNIHKHVPQTYNLMFKQYFTHATPTLFNASTPNLQMSFCFLVCMKDDSIEEIYDTLKNYALISKSAGGIGISIHHIQATGSYIAASVLVLSPSTLVHCDQSEEEPWQGGSLCLGFVLCSPETESLVYGNKFEALYKCYEQEGQACETIPTQKLWYAILEAQIETSNPFMLYKDACNVQSNQKNLGVIKASNLCTKIVKYSSPNETAICNLASLALPTYITKDASGKPMYNFQKLHNVAKTVMFNLNRVINHNYYPIPKACCSNMRSCPIGIGVQGLANTFMALKMPFDSLKAKELNLKIFETIYHGAAKASCEMAKADGPYKAWMGSPAQLGQLQYDL